MVRQSPDSSVLLGFADGIGRWIINTSRSRFWFIWTQSGWVPYLGAGIFVGPLLVSAFPDLTGPWVFYIGALFAFGIFVEDLIVFFIDRHRRARGSDR